MTAHLLHLVTQPPASPLDRTATAARNATAFAHGAVDALTITLILAAGAATLWLPTLIGG